MFDWYIKKFFDLSEIDNLVKLALDVGTAHSQNRTVETLRDR
jgi:hypothetical protein